MCQLLRRSHEQDIELGWLPHALLNLKRICVFPRHTIAVRWRGRPMRLHTTDCYFVSISGPHEHLSVISSARFHGFSHRPKMAAAWMVRNMNLATCAISTMGFHFLAGVGVNCCLHHDSGDKSHISFGTPHLEHHMQQNIHLCHRGGPR